MKTPVTIFRCKEDGFYRIYTEGSNFYAGDVRPTTSETYNFPVFEPTPGFHPSSAVTNVIDPNKFDIKLIDEYTKDVPVVAPDPEVDRRVEATIAKYNKQPIPSTEPEQSPGPDLGKALTVLAEIVSKNPDILPTLVQLAKAFKS